MTTYSDRTAQSGSTPHKHGLSAMDAQIVDLTKRVAALEAAAQPAPTPTPPPTPPPTDTLPQGAKILVAGDAQTLLNAIAAANPGDTIACRGGVWTFGYRLGTITKQGTQALPITIRNYPGEVPEFHGTTIQALFGYHVGAAWLRWSGLTVYGDPRVAADADGGAIFDFVNGAHDITLEDLILHGGAAWASSQHAVYIGGGSPKNIVCRRVNAYGHGGKGAGWHSYHEPNGTGIVYEDGLLDGWDQAVIHWSDTAEGTLRRTQIQNSRIGVRHELTGKLLLDSNPAPINVTTPFSGSTTNVSRSGQSW